MLLAELCARLRQQGGNLTQTQIDALYKRYGLDQPEYVRFWLWISGFVRGDFGQSFQFNQPVNKLIWDRLGLTLIFSMLSGEGTKPGTGVSNIR